MSDAFLKENDGELGVLGLNVVNHQSNICPITYYVTEQVEQTRKWDVT